MISISASIVIYKENPDILLRVVKNIMSINLPTTLVIVDNSPTNKLHDIIKTFTTITYIHKPTNVGFGKGHNIAFKSLSSQSNIHLIINPDIYFDSDEIEKMIVWMHKHPEYSLSVPLVYYPDGEKQYTVRNIPTISTLIKRRMNFFGIFNSYINKDEYQDITFNSTTEIPFAHGCFFIFQTNIFTSLQGFDERFFMYMEDVDIFIRAKKFGKTVINPEYKIYHEFRKGSAKSFKLLTWHLMSAFKFFLKYNNLNQKQ